MGRITQSFRAQFKEELKDLKPFRDALIDAGHRDAFDSLVKVWGSTQGSMSYADIPFVLDTMLVTAVIDNRKLILQLSDAISIVTTKIEKIKKLLT